MSSRKEGNVIDLKVSQKEKMYQPNGPVMELKDDIFDLFLIHGNPFDENIITDVEMIDDPDEEQLDRAMFAIVKQKGMDPVDPEDGNQWSEYILGEVPSALLLVQLQQSVHAEGPGVRLTPVLTPQGTDFNLALTNPRKRAML